MSDTIAAKFNGMIMLSDEARSAFCSLGYDLCTNYLDLKGKMPVNYVAALRKAYVQAEWGGNFDHFNLDTEGYFKVE